MSRCRRTIVIAGSLFALVAAGLLPVGRSGTGNSTSLLAPQTAEAQSFSQRTILGKVYDDTGTAVGGATVFLKNDKTRDVKSFTRRQMALSALPRWA